VCGSESASAGPPSRAKLIKLASGSERFTHSRAPQPSDRFAATVPFDPSRPAQQAAQATVRRSQGSSVIVPGCSGGGCCSAAAVLRPPRPRVRRQKAPARTCSARIDRSETAGTHVDIVPGAGDRAALVRHRVARRLTAPQPPQPNARVLAASSATNICASSQRLSSRSPGQSRAWKTSGADRGHQRCLYLY